MGDARDRARPAARAAEVAGVSLTRRQLVVRSGALALWATAGGAVVAERLGVFDDPPPFDRSDFPTPGRRARRS